MGTHSSQKPWKIDFFRFRIYLREKYQVKHAYYYIGYMQDENRSLYAKIQEAGFILLFRKHSIKMVGQKKGNVDSDIIFDIMKKLIRKDVFDGVVLISGDGDFRMLVDFLIEEKRFKSMLFPNKKYASSLYRKLSPQYYNNLDKTDIRKKIGIQK